MSYLNSGKKTLLLFAVLSTAFLQACGGGSSTGTNPSTSSSSSSSSAAVTVAPILTLPEVLDWQENQTLSYTIPAEGTGTLSYILEESVDSGLFTLNESTGVLTASVNFDFESPTDADQNGVYELSIAVSNENNQTTQSSFTISVLDIDEYNAKVSFPALGSNVGGYEGDFHIRGYLEGNGVKALSLPDNVGINVNGVAAIFYDDGTGNWAAEVPLQIGDNALNIEVLIDGQVESTRTVSLQNTPVLDVRTQVSDGITSRYAIDLNATDIIKSSLNSDDSQSILSVKGLAESTGCEVFVNILLSSNGQNLAVLCSASAAINSSVILIDLADTTSEIYPLSFKAFAGTVVKWVNNGYLFFRDQSVLLNQFYLLDFSDGSTKNFSVTFTAGGGIDNDILFTNGAIIYSNAFKSATDFGSVWAHFDLTEIINTTDTVSTINATEETGIPLTNSIVDMYAKDNIAYFTDGVTLYLQDFTAHTTSEIPLSPAFSPQASFGSAIFVFFDGSKAVFRYTSTRALFSVDLKSGVVTPVYNGPALSRATELSVKPDNSEMFSYSRSNYRTSITNLETYDLLEVGNIGEELAYADRASGHSYFDWQNRILYRSHILSFVGVSPSDESLLSAYDFDANTDTVILTSNVLHAYFNVENARYRVDDVTIAAENILWFSAVVSYSGGGGSEGVYALDKQTGVITEISQTVYDDSVFDLNGPYLSDYIPELDGVILTKWNDGSLAILKSNGDTTVLVEPETPYIFTRSAHYDSERELIYFNGYYKSSGFNFPDNESIEIIEYDLKKTENQQRLVSSRAQGVGFSFARLKHSYNQKQQLIYAELNGHLLIIDSYSGDRVIKEY